MKCLLLALLFAPLFSLAQAIALVDRKLVAPMQVAENVQLQNVQDERFPVYMKDIDSVIGTLESYRKWIQTGRYNQPLQQTTVIGHSSFYTEVGTANPRDRYRIVFSTEQDNYKTSIVLVDKTLNDRQALQSLSSLIDYLRNNLAVVREK